jgi:hypothetical protein
MDESHLHDPGLRSRLRAQLPLLAILLLAAALRFTGLGWDLRHPVHIDEQLFVDGVAAMLSEGDLDPGYYEYPGVPFFVLLPVLVAADSPPFGPVAYLAARGLIAAAGVASVGLLALLGGRLVGRSAGLAAALWLAVSPCDVHTAHMFRPDVLLQVGALLSFLAFARLGSRLRPDLLAGAALGLSVATKFTGAFLVPAYLLARWRAPGPRLRALGLGLLCAGLVFVLLTPYLVWRYPVFLSGIDTQVTHHYDADGADSAPQGSTLAYYLERAWWTLGPAGAILAVVGLAGVRRRPGLAPLVLHAVTTLAVMSTADLSFQRHLVPILPGLHLIAASALERLQGRRSRLRWLLVGLVALVPLARSTAYVMEVSRPSTRDRAADWITQHQPHGTRVLTLLPLGLDRSRYEVVWELHETREWRLVAPEVDLIVAYQGAAIPAGLEVATTIPSHGRANGVPVVVWTVPDWARHRYRPVGRDRLSLATNAAPDQLSAAIDGDPATYWSVERRTQRPVHLGATFEEPVRVGRLVLELGSHPRWYRPELRVEVSTQPGQWRKAFSVNARPETPLQVWGDGHSQVLLLEPQPVLGVRLVHEGWRAWGFSELRVDELIGGHNTDCYD